MKAYTSGGFVCYDIPSDVIYTFCRQPEAFLAQTGKLQSDVRFPWLQLLFNLMTCLTKENKSVPGVLMLNFEKCKKKGTNQLLFLSELFRFMIFSKIFIYGKKMNNFEGTYNFSRYFFCIFDSNNQLIGRLQKAIYKCSVVDLK